MQTGHKTQVTLSLTFLAFYSIAWNYMSFLLLTSRNQYIKNQKWGNICTTRIFSWLVTQAWFPVMVTLLKDFLILLSQVILILPSNRKLSHPLNPKMKVLAVHLSRKFKNTQSFIPKSRALSEIRGDNWPGRKMNQSSADGLSFHSHGKLIPMLLIQLQSCISYMLCT